MCPANHSLPTPSETGLVGPRSRVARGITMLFAAAAVSACGPGHVSDAPGAPSPGPGGSGASAQYAQQCSASNPYRGDASTATRSGSLGVEKQWVRAYIDEAYLWYSKVPALSATASKYSDDTSAGFYTSIDTWFSDLTVDALIEDRFSFTYPTKQWKQLSEGGVSLGYGFELYVGSSKVPRVFRIAYVDPASSAGLAGVQRGDTVVSIDGVSVDDESPGGIGTLNAGLSPAAPGSHTFVFSRNGLTRTPVVLTASEFAMNPVPQQQVLTINSSKVGYILFNDHVLTAENRLANTFTDMASQGVTDLVLDLRYNRGGYLFIASEVAYMIAGSVRTQGKTFERLRYNDKRNADNQSSDAVTLFDNTLCLPNPNDGFRCAANSALPTLNLSRVFVLSGADTCSASEAIVNGLRGVDVEVVVVGGTTCGKPYGFTAKDNCGISYFPIEFQGVNNKGFGDYGSGFTPNCAVSDDFDHALGDPNEAVLKAALSRRATGVCPTTGLVKQDAPAGRLLRKPEREAKLLLPGNAALPR